MATAAGTVDLTRPEITVGYAMVDQRNAPFPTTVAATERGAMLRALSSVFTEPVTVEDTDAAIRERFLARCGKHYRISAVTIEAVDVIAEAATG